MSLFKKVTIFFIFEHSKEKKIHEQEATKLVYYVIFFLFLHFSRCSDLCFQGNLGADMASDDDGGKRCVLQEPLDFVRAHAHLRFAKCGCDCRVLEALASV